MIFNVVSARLYALPVLNSAYPKDISTTVISGGTKTVTFSAKDTIAEQGNPAEYTYQWYDSNGKITGATGETYSRSVSGDLDIQVWCEITNKAGTVTTRKAKLQVVKYFTPVLNSSYPANVSVKYDSGSSASATFKVDIATAGNPASYTYQWYYDNVAVSGETGSTYTRTGINTTGTHSVHCVVTNAAGSVKSRVATLTSSQPFVHNWTGSDNMAFYYGDGSSQNGTTLVGSHYEWNDTRYGQVLWFTTDAYGGTEFNFTWKPVSFTGDDTAVYCRISEVRSDGCTNHSGNAIYMFALSGGGYGCSGQFTFKPNTKYYVYINRSDKSYGYHHYASDHSGWGKSSITIR